MDSTNFAYWLQGALELFPDAMSNGLSGRQIRIVQDHLDLVFNKVTPDRSQEADAPLEASIYAVDPRWPHIGTMVPSPPPDPAEPRACGLVEPLPTPSTANVIDGDEDALESGIWTSRTSGASSNGFSSPQAPEWGNWGDSDSGLPACCGTVYC